jgi:hypothetical protein
MMTAMERRVDYRRGNEGPVIASDNEVIQTKPQLGTPSLDCFALLAMTDGTVVC